MEDPSQQGGGKGKGHRGFPATRALRKRFKRPACLTSARGEPPKEKKSLLIAPSKGKTRERLQRAPGGGVKQAPVGEREGRRTTNVRTVAVSSSLTSPRILKNARRAPA